MRRQSTKKIQSWTRQHEQHEAMMALFRRHKNGIRASCGHRTELVHIDSGTCFECWQDRRLANKRLIQQVKRER